VIADNVGDNVGDCAGMAADLFETYAVTIVVATMLLAIDLLHRRPDAETMMMLSRCSSAACASSASIIGTFFVRSVPTTSWARCTRASSSAPCSRSALIYFVTARSCASAMNTAITVGETAIHRHAGLFWCALIGLGVTGLLVWITEYYTGTNSAR
jgi:K(+)-stimulated pyrophosphate-energized sodium pump